MDTSKNTFMTAHFEELDLIPKFMEGFKLVWYSCSFDTQISSLKQL